MTMPDLEAPIAEVTVYADRALVTRRGSIHLAAGEHELRINNLPQLLRESLRATAFYSRPPETELLTLQTELELLRHKHELLDSRMVTLRARRKWLDGLGEQAHDFARGLAWGRMKPQDCADFLTFMSNQAQQDMEAVLDLEVQLRKVRQDIKAKERELASKQGTALADRLAAVISVALEQEGDFALELSYLVMGAVWHPQYDVRLQMNDEGNSGEVEVSYVGMVQQSTGERWENVSFALSTARPSLAAVLPELDPWYLNVYTPPHVPVRAPAAGHMAMMSQQRERGVNQPLFAAAMPAAAEDGANIMEKLLSAPAEIATASIEQSGPAYLFRAGRSVDIPSDNSPHKTTIARDNLPCTFDYVSAPAIEENAHLRATITNTTERVLLEGEASIFLGGDYVGTTRINMTAPNEKFNVFLGLDDAIKVRRELIERAVDKGNLLQNDIRRITYAYRITVHNYTAFPRSIVVRDHLPVSQHERVRVRVQSVQPQPAERTKLEILKWRFTLPANGEQKIEYHFIVEHPQDLKVIGLP
jgi:uncharacterized protein (TIGR02231 family)